MVDAFGRLSDAERRKEWQSEIDRRDEIINSNKDLIATLYDDLKRELRLKNDLVLMAYPAMDAMARLNRHLDTFKYANDVMTIVQIRDVISAPSAENLKGRIATWYDTNEPDSLDERGPYD